MSNPDNPHRTIRSFVRREGRITPGQQRALDEIWPHLGIDHPGEVIEPETLFGNSAPVELEIGCGDGGALAQMAMQRPSHNFIGIEVYRPGVGNLLKALVTQKSTNVRLFNYDAVEVVTDRIPPKCLDRIMVFFPDPWPKKKHHKRRLLNQNFLQVLQTRLKTGGELHIATDWQEYAQQVMESLDDVVGLSNCSEDKTYVARPETRPLTKYERRGQRLGHGVWDILFRRDD